MGLAMVVLRVTVTLGPVEFVTTIFVPAVIVLIVPLPLAEAAIVNVPAPGVNVIFDPANIVPCLFTLDPSTWKF